MFIFFQAVFPKRRLQTFWEQIVFRDGKGVALNATRFVHAVAEVYDSDKEAFRREIKAAYRSFMPIFDKNLDCMFDKNEFLLGMQIFNFNNSVATELKYFKSLNVSNGVPLSNMINAWVDFQTVLTGDQADLMLIKRAFQRPDTTPSGHMDTEQE